MPGSNSLLVRSQKDSAQYDRLKVQNLKVTNALNTNNVISDQIFVFENFYLYNATLNVDSNTITANKDNILATIWSDRPNKIKINLSDNDVVELLRASFDDSIGNYSFKNNNPNMIVMINNSVVILTLIDYSVMGDEVTFFYENNFNSQIVDNYTGKISIFIDTIPINNLQSGTTNIDDNSQETLKFKKYSKYNTEINKLIYPLQIEYYFSINEGGYIFNMRYNYSDYRIELYFGTKYIKEISINEERSINEENTVLDKLINNIDNDKENNVNFKINSDNNLQITNLYTQKDDMTSHDFIYDDNKGHLVNDDNTLYITNSTKNVVVNDFVNVETDNGLSIRRNNNNNNNVYLNPLAIVAFRIYNNDNSYQQLTITDIDFYPSEGPERGYVNSSLNISDTNNKKYDLSEIKKITILTYDDPFYILS